ncbi:MAG: uncharacterized protein K0S15_138 [Solirubrobacterales bacterium]|jgi:hypothetical protein|nr:uncharacterized protein [Solirubrobacterales bacterium]
MERNHVRAAGLALVAALVACLTLAPAATAAQKSAKKVVTKTFLNGVGSPTGGIALPIPDGAGMNTQLVRVGIPVRGLNPRGKIRDVNVGVRIDHVFDADLEIYLASPRGVISLSTDNGGPGNDYGGTFDSCSGQFTLFDSDSPTLISAPGIAAPFAGAFAPEESLNLLEGLGNKKATNATWSLLVQDDDRANAAGTVFCSKLTISATNPKKKKSKK